MTYPKDGIYYIQSSSKLDCYASIRHGEDILRAEHINPMEYYQKWRLTEVNQSDASGHSEFLCTLSKEGDYDTLGVKAVKNNQPIYSIDGSQSWILDQAGEVYNISMNDDDGRNYSWCLPNKSEQGEPIVIELRGIMPSQSWQLVSAE